MRRVIQVLLAAAVAGALSAPAPAWAQSTGSLREDAQRAGLLLGAAVSASELDNEAFAALLDRHVIGITPENETKFNRLQPAPGKFAFDRADRILRWAFEHGKLVRGHALLWYASEPAWLEGATREQALAVLRHHIRTISTRFEHSYPGTVVQWDVANELVADDGSGLRPSVWARTIGPDFIDQAFRIAREELPGNVRLYYNEYLHGLPRAGAGGNACDAHPKCRAVRGLVATLVSRGVPIDGFGLQAHVDEGYVPDFAGALGWVREAGIKWAITELDVPLPEKRAGTSAARSLQNRIYRSAMATCLADAACDTFVTWGLSDRYTWWRNRSQGKLVNPLPFDVAMRPKAPAFTMSSLLQALPANAKANPAVAFRRASLSLKVSKRSGRRYRIEASRTADAQGELRVTIRRPGKDKRLRTGAASKRWTVKLPRGSIRVSLRFEGFGRWADRKAPSKRVRVR